MSLNRKVYAAYGSNMNTQAMKVRCPQSWMIGIGVIRGWRLVFRGQETGYANIEPAEQAVVSVVLWEISIDCEQALDEYEDYPNLYRKEHVSVEIDGSNCTAMLYRMTADYEMSLALPHEEYLHGLFQACDEHRLDKGCFETALREAREMLDRRG